ncbi:MAG: c-type cytochrome domain-containing protein [Verrucomicrobiales bacterium]
MIQPILRSRCYDCHGEEKQKGDLRLDTPEHIRLGGKSGPAIIAGDPEKSYLFELISLDESEDDIMPPKGKPLSEAQISWIGGWIREGAALGDGVAWPEAEANNSDSYASDPISAGVAAADGTTIQALQDGGVNVRKLSSDGNLLEIDYSHADRAKGDLRLDELLPIAENIYTLDLKRTKVTDDDLQVLTALTNLNQLHLQRTGITDAALSHLSGLTLLESLNLYSTEVSDAGLPDLRQLRSLKNLYLWSSKVTAEGARELAGVLGADVVNMGE